jgi:hypothetical protein
MGRARRARDTAEVEVDSELALAARGRRSPHSLGTRRRVYDRCCGKLNATQRAVVAGAALFLLLCTVGSVAATSSGVQGELRSCQFCKALNCADLGWWSCCLAVLPGSCTLELHADAILGTCDVDGLRPFNATCDLHTDSSCVWDPSSTSRLCQRLCFDC